MTPAESIAGAHCIIARHRGRATAFHPVRCRYCAEPLEELEAEVYAPVSGMDDFMRLPEKRRHELVAKAGEILIASWMDGL